MDSVPKMSKGTHTLFVRNDGKGPVCERDRCKERQTFVYMYCGRLVSRKTSFCGTNKTSCFWPLRIVFML